MKKRIKILNLVIFFLTMIVLNGCSNLPAENIKKTMEKHEDAFIEKRVDKFDNYETVESKDGYVLETKAYSYDRGNVFVAQTFFKIRKFTKDSTIKYNLWLIYTNKDWLFIKEGESLVLLVDGERIGLYSSEGSVKYRETTNEANRGVGIRETAIYDITEENIKKLANAKSVSVKITGNTAFHEINVKMDDVSVKSGFEQLKYFTDKYVN